MSSFDHHCFFAVRLPYRPVTQLLRRINEVNKCSRSDYNTLLYSLLDQPGFDKALLLSSPGLYTAWQSKKEQTQSIQTSVESALWRYVFRAYGRATPYGIFAGVGMGSIGSNRIVAFGQHPWKTNSRPDITIINAVSSSLLRDSTYRSQLYYRLNNSLYEVAGQYRFSELDATETSSKVVLSSVDHTSDLELLVSHLRQCSQCSYNELINLYEGEFETEATEFIDALIDNQFLTSNLTLPVTGLDMAQNLLMQIDKLSPQPAFYRSLLEAHQHIVTQSSVTELNIVEQQRLLQSTVDQIDSTTVLSDPLLQTDLYFHPDQLQLDVATTLQIAEQFNKLVPILTGRHPSTLEGFVSRFRERYDKQEIDLLMALDPELGIGFTADSLTSHTLLAQLPNPVSLPTAVVTQDDLSSLLYSRYLLCKGAEVIITDADIKTVDSQIDTAFSLPPTWYLHGELYNQVNTDNLDQGTNTASLQRDWRFIVNSTVSSSAAFFLGRFCHGHQPLKEAVQSLCAWEQTQYPDELLAEIVHLPIAPPRAGNVVARPILRSFEIPYLTPAGVLTDSTILLSDLHVSITDAGRVILRSKKTKQRIRPRLSSAHNSVLGDEVYQFLTSVQRDEYKTLAWSWGALNELPALPRLVYQNLVVAPAQWVIKKQVLPPDTSLTIEQLRTVYDLPRYVQFVEGDNKLLLDLDFKPAQLILLDEVKKQKSVLLKEWLGEILTPWLADRDDRYVSELVIPIKTITHQVPPVADLRRNSAYTETTKSSPVERSYMPGQDWLYLKVYLQEQVADQLLETILQPLIQQGQLNGWYSNFFFIRYADPASHLRIRFLTKNNSYPNLLEAWHQAAKSFVSSGLIHSLQLDTYQRELERYRPELIEHCEAIFHADSRFYLNWLSQTEEKLEINRLVLGLLSADSLLNCFGCTLFDKQKFSLQMQHSFFLEQGGSKDLKQKLNEMYRTYHTSAFDFSGSLLELTLRRNNSIHREVNAIQSYFNQTPKDKGLNQLIASLIHMSLNRVFPAHQRRYELIVYHFLARYYDSQVARIKKG